MIWYLQVYSSEAYLEPRQTSQTQTGLFWKNKLLYMTIFVIAQKDSWMFGRVLNTSMEVYAMLWQFLENNSFTKVMTSIVSATLPGVETLIVSSPFYENQFSDEI